MTSAELGRFMREVTPGLRNEARKGVRLQIEAAKDMEVLLFALDCAMGLIQRSLQIVDAGLLNEAVLGVVASKKAEELATTLRLVLGEGGEERRTPWLRSLFR